MSYHAMTVLPSWAHLSEIMQKNIVSSMWKFYKMISPMSHKELQDLLHQKQSQLACCDKQDLLLQQALMTHHIAMIETQLATTTGEQS